MDLPDIPLLITFADGALLHRERPRPSQLPIVGNGPAGTFVLFPHLALRVSLPTDQVVYAADADAGRKGPVRVGFGGMAFRREESGQLVFDRVKELHPEAALSPDRSHVMRLDPAWVRELQSYGQVVWRALR